MSDTLPGQPTQTQRILVSKLNGVTTRGNRELQGRPTVMIRIRLEDFGSITGSRTSQ